MTISNICVYCGSSSGVQPIYKEAATEMGMEIAARGLTLVYGGGKVGLMGAVADGALAAGGRVVGVMPQALVDKEIAHKGLSELHVVASMHERKAKMAELSHAFVAMPGGFGTFEEIFEVMTWAQLGYHEKACAILNIAGFYDTLIGFVRHAITEGFIGAGHFAAFLISTSPAEMLDTILKYDPPLLDKWSR
jgi:uncharacterized protein (TIGR00730 family)